jgi:hypothetical protein
MLAQRFEIPPQGRIEAIGSGALLVAEIGHAVLAVAV